MTSKRKRKGRSAERASAAKDRHRGEARNAGDRRFPLDPMATVLEDVMRPRLADARRAAARAWAATLGSWAESEAAAPARYDTERIERLIECAWSACCDYFRGWDPRFALQAIRTVPPLDVALIGQSLDDSGRVRNLLRLLTAAALASGGERWPRGEEPGRTWIELTPEQWLAVTDRFPEALGGAIGAGQLLYQAQGWYRWAGKGKRIQWMPCPFTALDEQRIAAWSGEGILILPGVELNGRPDIDWAVATYERRKAASEARFYSSGMLPPTQVTADHTRHRFWGVGVPDVNTSPIPIHVPALDQTFLAPGYYPMVDLDLESWVDLLRPFEPYLQERTGLDSDQLLVGLRAISLVVEQQTQCGWLRLGHWRGKKAWVVASPAKAIALRGAVDYLASLTLRGMLRNPLAKFRASIICELERLGSNNADRIADTMLTVFSGLPAHHGLPKPILFLIPDELTCILDLSLWPDFKNALLAWVTSAEDSKGVKDRKGNLRGTHFEEQTRRELIAKLGLDADAIPWNPNRKVVEMGSDHGDVDFCFLRQGFLFNLDMKSWQRSEGYHIGHFHAIQDRQRDLEQHLEKVDRRGAALMRQVRREGTEVLAVLNLLVVAFPEYLAPDRPKLWYEREPRVVTVEEVVALASDGGRIKAMAALVEGSAPDLGRK
jgi:hypothetical protein